jgi:protein SCO1/2
MRICLLIFVATCARARSYTVDAIVLALDPAAQTMIVSHRPIARYMPAMVMPFRVEHPHDLDALYPGARFQFDLVITNRNSLARNVRKSSGADASDAASIAAPTIAAPRNQLPIGAGLPDFQLTDQLGRAVQPADLRGKVVAINFIYTRCPLPDVCPRLCANFATLQRRFRDQLNRDLMLISVTVDPDYDTPAVIADYAKRWAADPAAWRFLTGDIARLAAGLGEVYWTDEGSIGHNSTTSIIGRDGRLAARVEGSNYRIDQLEHLIARELEKNPK